MCAIWACHSAIITVFPTHHGSMVTACCLYDGKLSTFSAIAVGRVTVLTWITSFVTGKKDKPRIRLHSLWHEYLYLSQYELLVRVKLMWGEHSWSLIQAQTLVIQSPLKIWWKLWITVKYLECRAKVDSPIAVNVVDLNIASYLYCVLYK